ncbi:elongation factor P 5-aminopentanone reductase [uncultured Ruminococcus sp.]|uniref:elongation factor P 5-aminopentanone reductase n=1 Tax=uncultured Ruminococcus sp. TaxID=165186 RepID=UPI0025FF4601|nr:3-oxoacyl-ACP reductase FabG [uncultured Ruminococcus sp.]
MKKTALVTGGSGGIGSEVCKALAEDGWQVAVCYKSGRAAAEALVTELKGQGLCAEAFHCDIGDSESIERCISEVRDSFGMVTLLVNNAGTADIELFTDMTDEKLCEMLEINLLGAMRMSRGVLTDMIREHTGNIINITSVWGEKGASCEVAYSAAKAGLIGFTKALAREVAISGIRVNCISCGMIDTKMNGELTEEDVRAIVDDIPAGRIGLPRDVANAVRFLSSEGADYIHGQVIRVDGCWI